MNQKYPFTNPPLHYDYGALEPFIDEKTLHFHHDKHLQTYVDNLNAALEQDEALQSWTLEQLILGEIRSRIPAHAHQKQRRWRV